MIYKKGNYIISDKTRLVILLAEDYNTEKDDWAKYVNYFNVYYKKYRKKHKIVKYLYAEYEDLNGGSITVDKIDDYHLANKYVVKLCSEEINKIKNKNKK